MYEAALQGDPLITDRDIADRDIADCDIADRDIADRDMKDRDIADRDMKDRDRRDRVSHFYRRMSVEELVRHHAVTNNFWQVCYLVFRVMQICIHDQWSNEMSLEDAPFVGMMTIDCIEFIKQQGHKVLYQKHTLREYERYMNHDMSAFKHIFSSLLNCRMDSIPPVQIFKDGVIDFNWSAYQCMNVVVEVPVEPSMYLHDSNEYNDIVSERKYIEKLSRDYVISVTFFDFLQRTIVGAVFSTKENFLIIQIDDSRSFNQALEEILKFRLRDNGDGHGHPLSLHLQKK